MSQSADQHIPAVDAEYVGKFEYEIRSTVEPFHAEKMGVVWGEIHVDGPDVYVFDTDDGARYKEATLAMLTAENFPPTGSHDVNVLGAFWEDDETFIVQAEESRKLTAQFYEFADDSDRYGETRL